MTDQTFVQLRHMLGFGVVKLKVLLALKRSPLDEPGWYGTFRVDVGPNHQVKWVALFAVLPPESEEVRIEDVGQGT